MKEAAKEHMEQTQTGNGEVVVEIKNLYKSFGEKAVLKGVNLSLYKGENLVILGKSGSGKSVLIKCIVRLIMPDKGKLLALGKNVPELKESELNRLRKQIGFLFQSAALYDSMTVRENLEFPLRNNEVSPEEIDKLVEEALKNVNLSDVIDKMPSELSGGMRKRLGLARTVIVKPLIMLYDEPTTGLDPITSKEISELILQIQEKYQTSSIIITHDIECARITANRILVLKDGTFRAEGTFEELQNSSDPFVQSFFESGVTTSVS
jgi:phospholipid/cholesterol/gamma-HCH transport system ATP-binding protein